MAYNFNNIDTNKSINVFNDVYESIKQKPKKGKANGHKVKYIAYESSKGLYATEDKKKALPINDCQKILKAILQDENIEKSKKDKLLDQYANIVKQKGGVLNFILSLIGKNENKKVDEFVSANKKEVKDNEIKRALKLKTKKTEIENIKKEFLYTVMNNSDLTDKLKSKKITIDPKNATFKECAIIYQILKGSNRKKKKNIPLDLKHAWSTLQKEVKGNFKNEKISSINKTSANILDKKVDELDDTFEKKIDKTVKSHVDIKIESEKKHKLMTMKANIDGIKMNFINKILNNEVYGSKLKEKNVKINQKKPSFAYCTKIYNTLLRGLDKKELKKLNSEWENLNKGIATNFQGTKPEMSDRFAKTLDERVRTLDREIELVTNTWKSIKRP